MKWKEKDYPENAVTIIHLVGHIGNGEAEIKGKRRKFTMTYNSEGICIDIDDFRKSFILPFTEIIQDLINHIEEKEEIK